MNLTALTSINGETTPRSLASKTGIGVRPKETLAFPSMSDGWSHMEWGAANYGSSRSKESSRFQPSEQQHALLLRFIESLVAARGSRGTIYLNDLEEKPTQQVAEVVRAFVARKGWNQLAVVEWPGDYNTIEIPSTTSARISHPQSSFFDSPGLLNRMSTGAETGLEVITHYKDKMKEMSDSAHGITMLAMEKQPQYLFPSGQRVSTRAYETRRYSCSSSPVSLLLSQSCVRVKKLAAGNIYYSWGTERRAQRLLGNNVSVQYTEEVASKLRPRETALLGPGLYCTENPLLGKSYGNFLFGIEIEKPLKVLSVNISDVLSVDKLAIKLGYTLGICDPRLQRDLVECGIQGLCTLSPTNSGIDQAALFSGGDKVRLHNGRALLERRSENEILKGPYRNETILTIKHLGLEGKFTSILKKGIEAGIPREELVVDNRTLGEMLMPFFDAIGRRLFKGASLGIYARLSQLYSAPEEVPQTKQKEDIRTFAEKVTPYLDAGLGKLDDILKSLGIVNV